jgi:hypothetical protein
MEMINMVKHKGQAHEYIMTEVRAKRLKNIGYDLKCSKCKKDLVIGDRVIHKRKRIYHINCWNNIWMDVPDELSSEEEFYIEHGYYPNSSTIASSTIPVSTIPIVSNS